MEMGGFEVFGAEKLMESYNRQSHEASRPIQKPISKTRDVRKSTYQEQMRAGK